MEKGDISIKTIMDVAHVEKAIAIMTGNLERFQAKIATMARPMGRAMTQMLPNNFDKVFSISDAVADSMNKSDWQGIGKKSYTWFSDGVQGAIDKLGGVTTGKESMPVMSRTDAINDALNKYKGFKTTFDDVTQSVTKANKPTKTFDDIIKKSTKSMDETSTRLKRLKGEFQGWALSIMFFGMAIQRVMKQIWQFGSKAFEEISNSVEGTTNGFTMLNGAMKYLGFTVGQALEPLAMALIPIVMQIADWVSQNPELVAQLVKVGAIIGTVLTVVGTLVLGISGLITAFWNVLAAAQAVWPIVQAIFTGISGSILAVIGIVVAAIAILVAMWQTNFGEIRDFTMTVFGDIGDFLKRTFDFIKGIFTDVFAFIKAALNGNSDEMLNILKRTGSRIINYLVDVLLFVGTMIVNSMNLAWSLVVDIVFKLLKGMINFVVGLFFEGIKQMISAIGSLFTFGDKEQPAWITNMLNGLDVVKQEVTSAIDQAGQWGEGLKKEFISTDDMRTKLFGDANGSLIDMNQFATAEKEVMTSGQAAGATTNNSQNVTNNITMSIGNVEDGEDLFTKFDNSLKSYMPASNTSVRQ